MTAPTRHHYRKDQRVLVEAVVLDFEDGQPYGAVTVRMREATDPDYIEDGVDAVVPQVLVHVVGVDVPTDLLDNHNSTEENR